MANEKMLEELETARNREFLAHNRELTARERSMLAERAKVQRDLLEREKQLQREQQEREKLFEERERRLHEQQFKFEHELGRRQQENAELRARLQAEITQRETQLADAERLLALEKARYTEESRKRLESKSRDYVKDALDSLKKNEDQFQLFSRFWGILGAVSLIGGVGFFVWVSIGTFETLPATISWQLVALSAFKGLVGLALFAALSKYSYLFSMSYMSESLKNSDRRHAINFGKFYLETYGSAAEWTQVKEAFEHWNIEGPNSFAPAADGQIDLTALEKAATAVEKIKKALPITAPKE
jgi:hypothetical protein